MCLLPCLDNETDLRGSGVVVVGPRHIPQTVSHACVEMRGDLTAYLGGEQVDEVPWDLLDWVHLGSAPICFPDAKSLGMMDLLHR